MCGICCVLSAATGASCSTRGALFVAMPGWVLHYRTDKLGYFVLQSSRYFCVTWRPCIRSHGSVYFMRLGDVDGATAAEAPWQQHTSTALDECESDDSSAASARSGGEARWGRRIAWHHACVHAWRREQAAVAHGCRNSFQSIDKPLPRRVVGRRLSRCGCSETHDGIRLVLPTGQKKSCHTSVTQTPSSKKKKQNLTRSSPKITWPTSHMESTRSGRKEKSVQDTCNANHDHTWALCQ